MNHIIKQHAPFLLIIVLLAISLVYFAVFRAPAQEAIFLVGEGEALPEFCVPPGVTPAGDQQVCARQSPSILYGASILASGDITDEDVAEGSFPIVALDGADKIINPTTSLLFDETNARLAINKESDNAMGLYVSNDDATDSPNARALVVVGKDVGLGSTTVGRLSYSGPGYLRDGAPTTGTDFYQNKVVLQAGEDTSGMVFHHASLTADGRFWWEMNGESKMILSDAGLGLFLDANGTTLPTEKLEVNGNIKVTAGNDVCIDGGNCLSTAGGGGGGGAIFMGSAENLNLQNKYSMAVGISSLSVDQFRVRAPRSGTLSNLYVWSSLGSVEPGSSSDVTVFVNGVATSLAVTGITSSNYGTNHSNTTDTVNVDADDSIVIEFKETLGVNNQVNLTASVLFE